MVLVVGLSKADETNIITCRPVFAAIVLIMEDHVRIINFEIFARNIAKDNRLGLEVNG